MHLFDNLLYKIVSLLIACVLWAAAQGVTDVEQSFDIPVQVEDVPENLVVIEESAHEINLRVMGSRAALRQVAKNVQHYPVSFEGAKAGETRLAVNKEQITLPRGARIVASSPSTLVFALEAVSSKVVPVRADFTGVLPDGYKLARVAIEPKEIAITGARSSVRNVREAVTDRVDLSTLRETTTVETPVALGYPHVWRKDPGGAPIRIRIEIEPAPVPSAGGGREWRRCASSSARMEYAGGRTSTR
jgi:YbbR domain-containing protein